jgi:UDP-2-acetamido-3-amino-2,3-dideoxy-glucuronate N-acetyltransferase
MARRFNSRDERAQTGSRLDAYRMDTPYFVHESSYIDSPSEIGPGTKIWHFSHVMKNCRIGSYCNIGQNVVISPDVVIGNNVKIQNNVSVYTGCILEDDVFCGPSMVFTNVINPRSHVVRKDEYRTTLVRRGASLGANCTVVCGITVGQYAFIGAGAVVTRDVPDYALMYGNPATLRGWMCQCGIKLAFDGNTDTASCPSCHSSYSKRHNRVMPVGRLETPAPISGARE